MGRYGSAADVIGEALDQRVARLSFCATVTAVDTDASRVYIRRDDSAQADSQGYLALKHVWARGIAVGDRVTVNAYRDYPLVTGVVQR